MSATREQRTAAAYGAGVSELMRRHGMSYGDAGRLVERVRNAGARQADDVICQCCGARGHSETVCSHRP